MDLEIQREKKTFIKSQLVVSHDRRRPESTLHVEKKIQCTLQSEPHQKYKSSFSLPCIVTMSANIFQDPTTHQKIIFGMASVLRTRTFPRIPHQKKNLPILCVRCFKLKEKKNQAQIKILYRHAIRKQQICFPPQMVTAYSNLWK